MNVLELVQPEEREDGRAGVVISANELYGGMLANMKEVEKGGTVFHGETDMSSEYRMIYAKLPREAWELASMPYDEAKSLPADKRELRFNALEEIRRFFTQKLHEHLGNNPFVLHITRDEENRWRL